MVSDKIEKAGALVGSPATRKKILEYQRRRDKRLKDRGLVLYKNKFDFFRTDADGDEDNDNNNGGGESHGNTRLPFGLCKRFGIEIGAGWTPKDAWDALAGKGITPEGAYEKLKKGEDPGTSGGSEEPVAVKPKSKKIKFSTMTGEEEYEVTGAKKRDVIKFTGEAPWVLMGSKDGGEPEDVDYFHSKREMLEYLKRQGVEEFEDPETGEVLNPTEMEFPELKKTWHGKGRYAADYDLSTRYYDWSPTPWQIEGKRIEGSEEPGEHTYSSYYQRFKTKEDMLYWAKENGLEELIDPETGEAVNPQEVELPERVLLYDRVGYKGLSIGLRAGRYTIIGEQFDGKKTKLMDFASLAAAQDWIKRAGGDPEKAKLSPSLKKREKERVSWLTSDKVEYVTGDDGVKYGDLRLAMSYPGWALVGESEDGRPFRKSFSTKAEAMQFMKEQGCEKVKVDKESFNPMEYELPATVATIKGTPYQEVGLERDGSSVHLYGKDLDGKKKIISYPGYGRTVHDFMEHIKTAYGVDESKLTITDEERSGIDALIKEEEERDRRRKEFESKAVTIDGVRVTDPFVKVDRDGDVRIVGYSRDGDVTSCTYWGTFSDAEKYAAKAGIAFESLLKDEDIKKKYEEDKKRREEFEKKAVDVGGTKYSDLTMYKDSDGDLWIGGFDERGRKARVSSWGDMYDMDEFANEHGLDINKIIQSDDLKEEYKNYKSAREGFDKKAISIGGGKYADCEMSYSPSEGYVVTGRDARGRTHEIIHTKDWQAMVGELGRYGLTDESVFMSDKAKKQKEKALKAKELLDTGEWYSMGGRDTAFTDLRVEKAKDTGDWLVIGKDMDGKERTIGDAKSTWDEAVSEMEKHGVKKYGVKEGDKDIGMPKYGMHKVMLMRKPGGGYIVYADSKKYGKHAVMYEDPKEENARAWLEKNGIPAGAVKTRGMNPNDDVPRTHTARSLENFDTHRMERAENDSMLQNMSDEQKQETARMLTEMFDKGAYRMRRSDPDHFASYVLDGFKNLLETGSSSGSSYKPGRRETGEKTYGHKGLPASETERYGFWGLDDDLEAYGDGAAGGYGSMQFKFKKDRVNDRMTYTFGDTLDAGRPIAGYAGPAPTIEGITGLNEYGAGADKLKAIIKDYRDYKAGKMNFNDFHRKVSRACQDGYVECQFHGPLKIEDVESIIMPKGRLESAFRSMSKETRQKVVTKLKDNGIKLSYVENGDEVKDGYEWIKQKYGE